MTSFSGGERTKILRFLGDDAVLGKSGTCTTKDDTFLSAMSVRPVHRIIFQIERIVILGDLYCYAIY